MAGYGPLLREAMIYWATLAVAVASVAGVYLLVRGTLGLDARAVSGDQVAATGLGVRVGRIRRLAYLAAALGAGAVGTLILFALQQTLSQYGAWYLVLVGGLAVAATLAAPRKIWGYASDRWNWSLLPVSYRVRLDATSMEAEGPG